MNKQNTLILIFILFASSFSSVYAQVLSGTLNKSTAECPECLNYYIKNGCFESYDTLLLSGHPNYMDLGSGYNYQFQKPLDVNYPIINQSQRRDTNCIGWYSPTGGTPNYFHANFTNDYNLDSSKWFSVPINRMCYNNGKMVSKWEGIDSLDKGYVGIFISPNSQNPSLSNREFIQQKLKNPLLPENCYLVSFDITLADNIYPALEKMGAYLSKVAPYNGTNVNDDMLYVPGTTNTLIKPQIISIDGIGSAGWTNVSGYITPDEPLNYITIGSFENEFSYSGTTAYLIDNVTIEFVDPSAYQSTAYTHPGIDTLINDSLGLTCNSCCEYLDYYVDIRTEYLGYSDSTFYQYEVIINDLRNSECKIKYFWYRYEENNNFSEWIEKKYDHYIDKEIDIVIDTITIVNPNEDGFNFEFQIYFDRQDTICTINKFVDNNFEVTACDFDFEYVNIKQDSATSDCCYQVIIDNKLNAEVTSVTVIYDEEEFTEPVNSTSSYIDLSNLICYGYSEDGNDKIIEFIINRENDGDPTNSCFYKDTLKIECSCNCSKFDNLQLIQTSSSLSSGENCCCKSIYLTNNSDCKFSEYGFRLEFLNGYLPLCDMYLSTSMYDINSDSSIIDMIMKNGENVIIEPHDSLYIGTLCFSEDGIGVVKLQPLDENQMLIEGCEAITKTVYCSNHCCDSVDVAFVSTDANEGECCWLVRITTENDILCSEDDISLDCKDEYGNTINSEGMICLSDTSSRNISYTISINGEECATVYDTLVCDNCLCPPASITKGWITLTSDKNGSNCSPENCDISASLNIDSPYADCFTGYDISYIIADKNANDIGGEPYNDSLNAIPVDGVLSGLPTCINAGETIQIGVRLYYYGSESEYCEIFSNEVFCPVTDLEERNDACTPDYLENSWEKGYTMVTIDGCQYKVFFRYRKNPDENQDVQITGYEKTNSTCGDTIRSEDVFKAALPNAIDEIVSKLEQFWCPQTEQGTTNCCDTWRVVQNSCWSTWQVNDQSGGFTEMEVPCDAECCVRQLRVCNTNGNITVQDLGYVSGVTFNCSNAQLPVPPPTSGASTGGNTSNGCYDANCDIYIDYIGSDNSGEEQDYTNRYEDLVFDPGFKIGSNSYYNDIVLMHRLFIQNDNMVLEIAQASVDKIELNIFNINGQLLNTFAYTLNGGSQEFISDISEISNGIYLYNITSGDKVVGRGKFTILR